MKVDMPLNKKPNLSYNNFLLVDLNVQLEQMKILFCRMIPYGCLSTGKEMGLIEVVPAAKTVMAIQHRGGKAASMQLDSSQLHKWIRERNSKEQ